MLNGIKSLQFRLLSGTTAVVPDTQVVTRMKGGKNLVPSRYLNLEPKTWEEAGRDLVHLRGSFILQLVGIDRKYNTRKSERVAGSLTENETGLDLPCQRARSVNQTNAFMTRLVETDQETDTRSQISGKISTGGPNKTSPDRGPGRMRTVQRSVAITRVLGINRGTDTRSWQRATIALDGTENETSPMIKTVS